MASSGGPTGTVGNGPPSTGMVPVSQPGSLQAAANHNSTIPQPIGPGSLPKGPSSGPIGPTNSFPGAANASGGGLPPSTHSAGSSIIPGTAANPKRKEIYKYEAPWTVYSMNWSVRPDKRFRLALGSFVEEYNNKVRQLYLLF